MSQYQIVFLDIDGTVLRPDDTIEASTKQAVAAVKEKGLYVFLATGRPLHEITNIAEELDIHSFIGYNGAYAVHKGEDILREPMDSAVVERLLQIAHTHHHPAVLYTSEKNVFTSLADSISQQFAKQFHLYQNEAFTPAVLEKVLGITLMNVSENEPALYDMDGLFLSQVNIEGFRHSYDVIRQKVNKGFAVQAVLNKLGIKREQSIAFGDGMNDKEMLNTVGEGFAMGNAHPDLFSYAKHTTAHVNDGGVYKGLQSLGLVE